MNLLRNLIKRFDMWCVRRKVLRSGCQYWRDIGDGVACEDAYARHVATVARDLKRLQDKYSSDADGRVTRVKGAR